MALQTVVKVDAPCVLDLREVLTEVIPLRVDAVFVLARDPQVLCVLFCDNSQALISSHLFIGLVNYFLERRKICKLSCPRLIDDFRRAGTAEVQRVLLTYLEPLIVKRKRYHVLASLGGRLL